MKYKFLRITDVNQIQLLPDMDLLSELCSAEDDTILYNEFVNRFLPELKAECLAICSHRKIDQHVGIQVAHDVFEKFRKYKSFESAETNTELSHKAVLVYLFSIARNLFNDWHNDQKKQNDGFVHKSYFDGLRETITIPDTPDLLKWQKDTALKIFENLNSKEKTVVLADIDHKKNSSYLPDEISEKLAARLKVKKATIRKIRERAIAKIKIAINEINQQ